MNGVTDLIRFFQSGGIFMFPLLFILALGTAIVIERLIVLMGSRVDGESLWRKLSTAMSENQLGNALKACNPPHFTRPLHRVLGSGIKGMKTPYTREDIQGALDEAMISETPRLEARLHYLPNLANVATLLGLLGTIMGLIDAFTAVGAADPSQKAALLSQGISQAMSTTAFGLVVAIPFLLMYTFLQAWTNRLIDHLDEYALKLLNFSAQIVHGRMAENVTSNGRSERNASDSEQPKARSGWHGGEVQASGGLEHVS